MGKKSNFKYLSILHPTPPKKKILSAQSRPYLFCEYSLN